MKKIPLLCLVLCSNAYANFFPQAQRTHIKKCVEEYEREMRIHKNNFNNTRMIASAFPAQHVQDLYALVAQRNLDLFSKSTEIAFLFCLNGYQRQR